MHWTASSGGRGAAVSYNEVPIVTRSVATELCWLECAIIGDDATCVSIIISAVPYRQGRLKELERTRLILGVCWKLEFDRHLAVSISKNNSEDSLWQYTK